MEYEWDEAKRLANLRKHGIDFTDVPAVFDGDILTVEDDRYSYGEQRFLTLLGLKARGFLLHRTLPRYPKDRSLYSNIRLALPSTSVHTDCPTAFGMVFCNFCLYAVPTLCRT